MGGREGRGERERMRERQVRIHECASTCTCRCYTVCGEYLAPIVTSYQNRVCT